MPRKTRIAVADAETDPFEYNCVPEPFVFGYYDGSTYEQFWADDCDEQFAEFIQDKDVICYFHNGGKFDFFFLLPFLESKLRMIKQRIAECQIGQAKLRDSFLIIPLPLSAHKKDEIDYQKFRRENRERHRREIEQYLYHDCIYLYDWVRKFVDRFGTGLTLPGAAVKQLKKTGYQIAKGNEKSDEKYRAFYYGGRVEAFRPGYHDGPVDYFDINSAYPYAMLFRHPRGVGVITRDNIPSGNKTYFAIVSAISRGALPYRNNENSIEFPNDDEVRTYYVTHWEIQAGLDTETLFIKRVHRVFIFVDTADMADFANHFYSEKLEAKQLNDKDTETFAKLMLNSCYGKFGQNPRNFKDYQITESGELPDEAKSDYRLLYGNGYDWVEKDDLKELPEGVDNADCMVDRGWYKVQTMESDHVIWEKEAPGDRFFNVATAASITGFVRAYLWRAICESEDVLYCDTDSIMARCFRGPIGDALGEWSREATFKHVWIGGKKLYTAIDEAKDSDLKEAWKVASKGARLDPIHIQRIVENREVIRWHNIAPSFSLTIGTRFISRDIKMTGVANES